jgi:putative SOS response-associated peptidase YedK
MCARYNLRISPQKLAEIFATVREIEFVQRFNVSPTQQVVTIRQEDGKRVPSHMRWGLVPSWSKDPKSRPPLINARGEALAEKPAFRTAFKKRRCLIPATGFYEWRTEGKSKLPFNIHLPDDIPFAFAGLWDCWRGGAEPLESCTIVTTEAIGEMVNLHDRQPVILHRHEWSVWLNPELEDMDALKSMIRPWDRELVFDAVDPAINNSRNEGAEFFKPGNTL